MGKNNLHLNPGNLLSIHEVPCLSPNSSDGQSESVREHVHNLGVQVCTTGQVANIYFNITQAWPIEQMHLRKSLPNITKLVIRTELHGNEAALVCHVCLLARTAGKCLPTQLLEAPVQSQSVSFGLLGFLVALLVDLKSFIQSQNQKTKEKNHSLVLRMLCTFPECNSAVGHIDDPLGSRLPPFKFFVHRRATNCSDLPREAAPLSLLMERSHSTNPLKSLTRRGRIWSRIEANDRPTTKGSITKCNAMIHRTYRFCRTGISHCFLLLPRPRKY